MSVRITNVRVKDVRFPTSLQLSGSDAMNPDPDYSAAYVILETDQPKLFGAGLTFTIGRGNELCVAAIQSMAHLVEGKALREFTTDMASFWRMITGDSQLRWVGPEKGVIHLATAAIVNAVWDLYAKIEEKPLWRLLCDMEPQELIDCIDFRYLTDELTPQDGVRILQDLYSSRRNRIDQLQRVGYPAYTTSAGWLGYSDRQIRELCQEAISEGWTHFKIKVGRDLDDDLRRCKLIRDEIGYDAQLMMDANQIWDVEEAIEWISQLKQYKPWFIEEPTSPDDILGHAEIAREIAPVKVATGEHCHNRVMFKQFLKTGGMQICQLDSCRLGGVNEILAVYLLAAKYNVPVCPHAGGVGLCEYVQHLSMFDYVCVSGTFENRLTEYSDHLHEHFIDPVVMKNGRYEPPTAPGYSITMKPESIRAFEFPRGTYWSSQLKRRELVSSGISE